MRKVVILFVFLLLSSDLFSSEGGKIALLFLTRSDLNQTEVWKNWFNKDYYQIYNHSKVPALDPWFSQFRISDIQFNEWGYLLLAQQALLRAALKDPSNSKFVFLSESCVPLRPSDEVYRILTSENKSYMRWCDGVLQKNKSRVLSEFPILQQGLKNHQWIILNRKHAQMMAEDDYWIYRAMRHICCDEAYPSSFFSMCGMLDEFKNEMTTYVDWFNGDGGPYVFNTNSQVIFDTLIDVKLNTHCLFARKFSKEFPSNIIERIIEGLPNILEIQPTWEGFRFGKE